MAIRSSNRETFQLLSVVVAVAIIAALYFAKVVFVPLALAVLFAFVLTPVVSLLERIRLRRTPATLVVILVTLACIGTVGWIIGRQFAQVINQLPLYQSNIEQKIDALHVSKSSTLRNASATITELRNTIASPRDSNGNPQGSPPPGTEGATAAKPVPVEIVTPHTLPLDSLQNALEFLLQVLIVIVFTSFMLIQRENLRNRFISLIGQRQLSTMTLALDEASARVSRYLRTQLTVNAIYGMVIGIGLHFIGIPGAFLWGVIVGVLRFLPYIGPPLGGIMPLLLSLAIFPGWKVPLITLAMFVTVEVIASHAIEPMVYGAHTGISSLAILVAAIFWTILWGPIGLVLSTPLTVCIVVMGRYVPHLGFVPVLLGGDPALPDDALVYQRLLATDQEEAEQILERELEKKSLTEVYDSVLIPALNLAEQDRHRGQIDENAAAFIFQSAREILDNLEERANGNGNGNGSQKSSSSGSEPEDYQLTIAPTTPSLKVLCVPARDAADELVATMLSQVLQNAGHTVLSTAHATGSLIETVKQNHPDVVFVSALPPFAISHSRALYRAVKMQSPNTPVVIGLWTFSGDAAKLAKRIGRHEDTAVVTTLSEALRQMTHVRGLLLDLQQKSTV